jgi:hypothetical protein
VAFGVPEANSLNEPTRCRIHSRATKIGQRMESEDALCSNGVHALAHEERIRPASDSSTSPCGGEGDARAVHDGEVARHRVVERRTRDPAR